MYQLKYVTYTDDTKAEVLRSISFGRGTDYYVTAVDGLSGRETKLTTSQGFGQVGNTIDQMTAEGVDIKVTGKIIPSTHDKCEALMRTILPMSKGRLYFGDNYWIDVAVKNAPQITQKLRQATYTFRFYAPYPYWRSTEKAVYEFGNQQGGFKFFSTRPADGEEGYYTYPDASSVPTHVPYLQHYSITSGSQIVNCKNEGDIKTDFKVTIYARGSLSTIQILNTRTQEKIKINESMVGGDLIYMYREDNILRCTKTHDGTTTDIFSSVDESTDLFYMAVGDNTISASATSGGTNMNVTIEFYTTKAGAYYGM